MNTVKNDSSDLVFRIVDGQENPTLIPVKTACCKLAKKDDDGNQICCSVQRDESGGQLEVLAGEVFVNEEQVQSVRLSEGDQIRLGDSCYQVQQLGALGQTLNGNVDTSLFNAGEIENRFRQFQAELDRQAESFKAINRKFDEMAGQISMLFDEFGPARNDSQSSEFSPSGQVSNAEDSWTSTQVSTPVDDTTETESNSENFDLTEHQSNDIGWVEGSDSVTDNWGSDSGAAKPWQFENELVASNAKSDELPTENSESSSETQENFESEANDLQQLLEKLNNARSDEQVVDETAEQSGDLPGSFTSNDTEASSHHEMPTSSDNERLESLFASLRTNEPVNTDENVTDREENGNTEHSLDEVSQFSQAVIPEPTFDAGQIQGASDSNSDESPAEDLDESVESSQTTSERELLNQLRSLQLEQSNQLPIDSRVDPVQHREESEVSAETDYFNNESVEQAPVKEHPSSSLGEQLQDETQSGAGQESVSELLSRMNLAPAAKDDEKTTPDQLVSGIEDTNLDPTNTVEPADTTTPQAVEEATQTEETVQDKQQGGSDVQDYMNSLLARLNEGSSANADSESQTDSMEFLATEPSDEQKEPVPAASATPLNPEEFVPKQVAPEINSNLAAMRELANATSRGAVNTSRLKRKQDVANSLLLISAGAIIAAVCTTVMSKQTGDTFYWLSILFFGVTTICSGIYAKRMLFNKASGKPKTKASTKPKFEFQSWFRKLSRNPEVDN